MLGKEMREVNGEGKRPSYMRFLTTCSSLQETLSMLFELLYFVPESKVNAELEFGPGGNRDLRCFLTLSLSQTRGTLQKA